jgi:hypothetical protein
VVRFEGDRGGCVSFDTCIPDFDRLVVGS